MRSVLSLLLPLVSAAAVAQAPLGDELQVNTYTANDQVRAAVGPDGVGGFIVAWASVGSSGTDTSGHSILGQRYAADGSPSGGEFQVNTDTADNQYAPAIGPDGDGGFVVAWMSYASSGTDTDAWSIHAQRYAADGSPTGGQFQVNSYTTGGQYNPAVGSDGGDGFVVVWESYGSSGSDSSDLSIQARRFAADGTPAGDDFQVNTTTPDDQYLSAVGPDGAGGFVVTWTSFDFTLPNPQLGNILAQRYAADGAPVGAEFLVNTFTQGAQVVPAVSPDGAGGFVIAWMSQGSSGGDFDGFSIQAQRFAADGSPVDGEFQVNTYTTDDQYLPAVGPNGNGGFVVTWSSQGSSGTDSSGWSIQGQSFGADGLPKGGEFQVNTYTSSSQYIPEVASVGENGFVVAWTSDGSGGTDSSGFSIQAQRYLGTLFADGFESGDLAAWSSVVP